MSLRIQTSSPSPSHSPTMSLALHRCRRHMVPIFLLLLLLSNSVAHTPLSSTASKVRTRSSAATAPYWSLLSPLQTFSDAIYSARSHLLAAAAARATSISIMYPVDTIKTRMQLSSTAVAGKVQPKDWGGLYRGVWGSLVGQVPYGVLTFGSYEIYKQSLLSRFPQTPPPLIYALSAVLGDITGSGWLCPSEVIKQQLQAGIYGSMGEAVKGTWRRSGVRGFYRGFTGGLARDVPFRVAQLTTFEITKNLYIRAKRRQKYQQQMLEPCITTNIKKDSKENPRSYDNNVIALSPLEAAICGAAAGSFSAAITNPLDKVKTLMMTDVANTYGGSVTACASQIVRQEGIKGLFSGVGPRVGYIAPSVCIFFVTYEFVQQRIKKRF